MIKALAAGFATVLAIVAPLGGGVWVRAGAPVPVPRVHVVTSTPEPFLTVDVHRLIR